MRTKNKLSFTISLGKLLFTTAFFFAYFVSTVSAQTDSMENAILQGTAIDLESQKQMVWQRTIPINAGNRQNFILDNIAKLLVSNKPRGVLILPMFGDAVFSGNTPTVLIQNTNTAS